MAQRLVRKEAYTPGDLRSFLGSYEREHPEDVVHIDKPTRCAHEMTAVAMECERHRKFPLLIFHKPILPNGEQSKFPLVLNLLSTRRRMAFALDSTFEDVGNEWVRRARTQPKAPSVIEPDESPCKDVIMKGSRVDIRRLPAMIHHELDRGQYISAGMLTTYDPESGVDNMAFQRGWLYGKSEIRMLMLKFTHNYLNLQKHEALKKDMPAAYWIGHHPAVLMGAQSSPPYPGSHYQAAGGVLGSPLRLTPSETLGDGFLVPADAEFVIEGYIKAGVRVPEGPFGDYAGYYDYEDARPMMEVTCVTHRKDAFWHSNMVGHDQVLGGTFKEVDISWAVKKAVPQVRRVYMTPVGYQFILYIQIKATSKGQSRAALLAALGCSSWPKIAVVVDDDINIYDDNQVFFALATRFQPDEDLIVVPTVAGSGLDPSAERPPKGMVGSAVGSRLGIDATVPFGKPFPARMDIPKALKDNLRIQDYISQRIFDSIPDFAEP